MMRITSEVAVFCFIASARLSRVGELPPACFKLLFQIGAGFVSSTPAR